MHVPFSRELWIEQDDFAEVPPPTCPPKSCRAGRRRKFFRLKPGGEVRLKYAYIINPDTVSGRDLDSKSGGATAGRKAESDETPLSSAAIKGTIHWVSATHCIETECRLYDRLFTAAEPGADGDFKKHLNHHSLEVVTAKCEPSLGDWRPEIGISLNGWVISPLIPTPANHQPPVADHQSSIGRLP
jgi:glutaminyl-tRNA synthetase